MHRLQLTVLFCGPSLFSGLVVGLLSVLILLGANFSYLLQSGLFYDALFGKGSQFDLIQSSHDTFTAISQTVLGNTILNKILFFCFWMMIGLFVYVTITTVGESVSETGEEIHSLGFIHARREAIERNLLLRLAIRFCGLLSGVLYSWLFLSLLMPFTILASRVGLDGLSHVTGWAYLALSASVLVVSLHAFVIIVRLIVLRPRAFGAWDSLG